ncbi:uncharacterized protein [Dermacentor andersoni]|uniref:uncharacterized protein n=1 Tax=Dermacentor andersoni TaxID=34620 RepID=UPI002155046A|nr:NLR family CARD domain-containing protein 3-like [Dermacentor andersoni]
MTYTEKIVERLTARGLDLDRHCQYEPDNDDCWLCRGLLRWNKVLHPASLELREVTPGRLAFLTLPTNRRPYGDIEELYDAAYVLSWLPRVHRCVQSVSLEGTRTVLLSRPASTVALTLGRSCNLRRLVLRGAFDTPVSDGELGEGLAALAVLEKFEFTQLPVSATLSRHMAELINRNAGHLASIVFESNDMSQNTTNRLLRAMRRCRVLSELSIVKNILGNDCLASVAILVRYAKLLRKLDLSDSLQSGANLGGISKALEVSTSLEELHFFQCELDATQNEADIRRVFEALAVNRSLRHLDLCGCNVDGNNAASLAKALRVSTGLRRLEMMYSQLDDGCAVQLAAALETNSTLEVLNLKENFFTVRAVAAFCTALLKNTTLKCVLFSHVQGSEEERARLSFQMAAGRGYTCIQMSWALPDIPMLSAAMAMASESPTELQLCSTQYITGNAIRTLLESLATNSRVKAITVVAVTHCVETVDALCHALASNRTIERLEIAVGIDTTDDGLLARVAKALLVNRTVSEVQMRSTRLSLKSAKTIAFLLSKNTSITKLSLNTLWALKIKWVGIISRALAKNTTVMKFSLSPNLDANRVSWRIASALRRNTNLLNLAVRFLAGQRLDGQAARAFETLRTKPSLLPHLKVNGQSDEDARSAVVSAQHYISSNYLRLAGVVQHGVVCHPSTSTQLDALNHDCWCAVTRYLSLSDVIPSESSTTSVSWAQEKKDYE